MRFARQTYEEAMEGLLLGSVIKVGDAHYILFGHEFCVGDYYAKRICPETLEEESGADIGISMFLGKIRREGAEQVVYTGEVYMDGKDKRIRSEKFDMSVPGVYEDHLNEGEKHEFTRRYDHSFHIY